MDSALASIADDLEAELGGDDGDNFLGPWAGIERA
jgi:hypothetical protein